MKGWIAGIISLVVVAYLGAAAYYSDHVRELSISQAANLIAGAPEFNRYARLVEVVSIQQGKDSMKRWSGGRFTFHYLNPVAGVPPIRANVQFAFWRRAWHLTHFDYGCPSDCHFVTVYNEPADNSHDFRDMMLFRPN
jgi:hypothetical protein